MALFRMKVSTACISQHGSARASSEVLFSAEIQKKMLMLALRIVLAVMCRGRTCLFWREIQWISLRYLDCNSV